MKHSVHKLLRLSWKIAMAGLVMPFGALTKAEVALDGTLGPAGSLAGPHFVIPDTVGQTVGTNLFHSFGLFNINTGESATFRGPAAIDNIISRVTGGSPSFIDGLLRSEIESANLWFINPAGVLFGQHASLDIQGSFHVSTADYLRLADGGRFEATNPENSVLTVAPPEAFGFLGENPAGITIQESILELPRGETLSIVGGDITVTGGPSGFINVPDGRINLASVGSPGIVALGNPNLGVEPFERLGEISISEKAQIAVANPQTSIGGGTVLIRGGRFALDDSQILADTFGNIESGGIDIGVTGDLEIRNESLVQAYTITDAKGGTISLSGGNVKISSSDIQTNTLGDGDAGDVSITATNFSLLSGATVGSRSGFLRPGVGGIDTGGNGRGGNVKITTTESVSISGGASMFSQTFSSGNSGNIQIDTPALLLDGGGISVSTAGTGAAGDIFVETDRLSLAGGGFISSSGGGFILGDGSGLPGNEGRSGAITINATESVSVFGRDVSQLSSRITTNTLGTSDAGSISINTGSLIMNDGGLLQSSTIDHGAGGNIQINAQQVQLTSGATISASTFGPGRGGNITVNATSIELSSEGNISAESVGTGSDAGESGRIFIRASDSFRLFDGGSVSVETAQTDAGNITLEVGDLLHLSNGSSITTSVAGGEGSGGNIAIGSVFVVLDEGSRIIANAERGQGGNILIRILGGGALFQSPDSQIEASSEFGVEGSVVIDAPDTDIIAGFLGLPANFLDAATVLTQLCAGRSGANVSSLVVRKYEVLPDSPYALRVQLPRAIPAPRTAKQSRAPRTYYAGNPLPPMISCLGNG
jgi:filamentous hemagglutinin family protein